MTSATDIALIINTADQPDYLARVLRAFENQSAAEILIADDGSGPDTRKMFESWSARKKYRTQHVWQEKSGFRRARILNLAIARAASEYIIFLDGDTIPHPEFVRDHRRLAARGSFVQGHRALIHQKGATWFGKAEFARDRRKAFWRGQISGWKHALRWPFPMVTTRADREGIRGCNLGIWREDLVRVNGYNEAFEGWGREDSELAVRLMNTGIQRRDVRGWALCYHLWHLPASRAGLASNDELLAEAVRVGAKRCERGLDQHVSQ